MTKIKISSKLIPRFRGGLTLELALIFFAVPIWAQSPVSDSFDGSSLNSSVWTFLNPVGDGSFTTPGGSLQLTAPAGADHEPDFGGVDNAVRVMQAMGNVDFNVTVKFDSIPTQTLQEQGVIVQQDTSNWLRFHFASYQGTLGIAADRIQAGAESSLFSSNISAAGASSLWMRIQRTGNSWVVTWSSDGITYNSGGSFTQTITASSIGPFAGNFGSPAPAMTAIVDYFQSGTAPDLTLSKTHTGNFTQGQTGATYSLTVTNRGNAATAGTVTVSDTVPTGLTATAIAGTSWTCTQPAGPCTRSDALAAGGSYPVLTLTVNVSSAAPASVTNTATVSGGGEINTSNDSASNPTTINSSVSGPDLTITKTHTGNFTQGQSGAAYSITVSNGGNAATSGTVTVSDTVPTGLTATSIAGTGWTCTQSAGPCTRSDALAAAGSYPALTLTVNVSSTAPASVTNTATVSGGGETNTSNDSASDLTTINSSAGGPVSDSFDGSSLNSSVWTFLNPVGDGSFTTPGGSLQLTAPAGADHEPDFGGVDNAVRVMQAMGNVDFNVTVKFDSIPTQTLQEQGVIVQQDTSNWLRFHFASYQGTLGIAADRIQAGAESSLFSSNISAAGASSLWMRIQRTGNSWVVTWSSDGITYNAGGSFTQTITASSIGPFAGNFGSPAPAMTAIVDYFQSGTDPDLTLSKTHTGNFTQGQTGATYSLTVTNRGNAATAGTVTVSDTVPTGLTATAVAGTSWTCTQPAGPCTRSDALAAGGSYPALTLTVNVSSTAPASVTNTATVSGGGEINTSNDSASNSTTINSSVSGPDLTITKTHTGNFTQGQSGAAYSITVSNGGNAATSGTVTVSDTVPTGLTATSIAGTGWTCTQSAGPCTRSDALAAAGSYPALTLTVNVSSTAPASVTNTATVSGGGETNTSNDSASDLTTINSSAGGPVSDSFDGSSLNSSVWTFLNPVGDGSFTTPGGSLQLTAPAGADHEPDFGGVDNAVRVMQAMGNVDFNVTVKFDSIPTQTLQEQGVIVQQDTSNWLRFHFASYQGTLGIAADRIQAGAESSLFSSNISAAGASSLWMRIQRTGNSWVVTWSSDGITYNSGGSFTQTITASSIGPFAGNFGSPAPAMTAIVDYFQSGTDPDLTLSKTHTGNFTQGQTGATYSLTVTNRGNAATAGTVTVSDTVPTGLTATAIAGTSWTCTQPAGPCTRSDALAAGGSYPALTLTVNVSSAAPASVTNTATVSGGGEINTSNDSASNPTTINSSVSGPDLTITKTHTGNFTQGQSGAAYSITVSNGGNAATSGTVTVSDTVPTGLTATSIAGTGWTCTQSAGPCTRSDALAAAGSYPALTLTVNVSSTAPASVTNTATVSGGGETNTSNDSASDLTTITSVSGGLVSDDFTSATLNSEWTFTSPAGGSYSLNGSSLLLSVPSGSSHDPWTNGDNSVVMVLQQIANQDFDLEVKFSSAVNINSVYQEQGIIVQQDTTHFLRFNVQSDNLTAQMFVASISGTTGTVFLNQEIHPGLGPAALSLPTYMRLTRTGNNWSFRWSYDSVHWVPPLIFTQAITVAKIGPYAGNSSFNGGAAPAFTAIVDHFVNRAAPPATVDGSSYPPPPVPPVINVWYSDTQMFGQLGQPQQWINILGDVSDFNEVTTLTYSLNGGAQQPLSIGNETYRLVEPGNFNAEIDYADPGWVPGSNTVTITATDSTGSRSTNTVAVNYTASQTWPTTYAVNWTSVSNIQSVAQVVDGNWQVQSSGVTTLETGYDRLIDIGDRNTWQNYTGTVNVTINWMDPAGFGVGVVVGWQGHSSDQYGQILTVQPRIGHPFPAFFAYSSGSGPPDLNIFENTLSVPESYLIQDTSGMTLQSGVTYTFKFQVQPNGTGGSHYSFKVWPASGTEPSNWLLQADGELGQGSILLAAHRASVSFGAVSITGQ